jgi:hypothetical protein
LIYPAAIFTSWRDFRANLRPISLLAIGLALGGTGIGLAIGWLAAHLQRRLDDPPVQITISLLTPLLLTFLRNACWSPAYWQWSRLGCFWAGVLRKSSPPGRGSS